MNLITKPLNAVAAIRVSSVKQGMDGDSPEDQERQIAQYARARGYNVVKEFKFLESASKVNQPMQEAVDYCVDPKNDVQVIIVKSIDRFTRGGSDSYGPLRQQLDVAAVQLIDVYGVIGQQKVNTLEHLDITYSWSVYSPTRKMELLEAERANEEVRDIETRMIGAQIRYARSGYWIRNALFGTTTARIETAEGKRSILVPQEPEASLVRKMFELRARGELTDRQIVDKINKLGYRSRTYPRRDKYDRTRVIGTIGGKAMDLKQFWRMIENPAYAGVNSEIWTQSKPVRCKFKGLIPVKLFNKANRGKLTIVDHGHAVELIRREVPEYLAHKGVKNSEYPYKRVLLCPQCRKPFYGSASRGKLGKRYPAYHCCKRGHYYRVPRGEVHASVEAFVTGLKINSDYIGELQAAVTKILDSKLMEVHDEAVTIDLRSAELEANIRQAGEKIKFLQSESAIRMVEEDILRLEGEITGLQTERQRTAEQKPDDMTRIWAFVNYFLEHLEELVCNRDEPELSAQYFSAIFKEPPVYSVLVSGTPENKQMTEVSELFKAKITSKGNLAGTVSASWNTCLRMQ